MPIIHYLDNFKIEVVKHYKMHRNIGATLAKYGIFASPFSIRCKKKRFIITSMILPLSLRLCLMNILSITTKSECIGL